MTTCGPMNVGQHAAAWASGLNYHSLPPEVVHQAKRCLLDTLGVMLGGRAEEAVGVAERTARCLDPDSTQVRPICSTGRSSVLQAAMVNGVCAHVLDYDDYHLESGLHPTAPVASAVLPVAEWRRATGQQTLAALVAGIEVENAIGMTVAPGHYAAGWHATGTLGGTGAAVGAGRLLTLDTDQLDAALGFAMSQAAGFREAFGTMVKSFHVGKAAANGVMAAVSAAEGLRVPADSAGGRRGFASVFSTTFDPTRIRSLGQTWSIFEIGVKPYSCGSVIHPSIDAVLQFRERLTLADVARIDLRVHPDVVDLTGIRDPQTGLEGKFSVYHAAAIALVDGHGRQAQFTDDAVRRTDVVSLRERIHAHADLGTGHEQSAVAVVTLTDRSQLTATVKAALGRPENPMSDEQMREKFLSLAAPAVGSTRAERAADRVFHLEEVARLADLVGDLTPEQLPQV